MESMFQADGCRVHRPHHVHRPSHQFWHKHTETTSQSTKNVGIYVQTSDAPYWASLFFSLQQPKKNSEKSFRGLSLIHLQGFAQVRQLVEQGLRSLISALQHADRDIWGRRRGTLWVPFGNFQGPPWLLVESCLVSPAHTFFGGKQPKSPPHHLGPPIASSFSNGPLASFFFCRWTSASSCWEICRGKLERGKEDVAKWLKNTPKPNSSS